MANEHGKVMEELLFDLGAEASLEANLEEASSAYHLLSNKFAEIERVLGDDDARGAILVAATIVGDNIDRVDLYMKTYKAVDEKFGDQNIPFASRIHAASNLFVSCYLSAGLSLLKS